MAETIHDEMYKIIAVLMHRGGLERLVLTSEEIRACADACEQKVLLAQHVGDELHLTLMPIEHFELLSQPAQEAH